MFETISHFVLGVVAIAILHIALTYGMSDKTNDNPKIRFLKNCVFCGCFCGRKYNDHIFHLYYC